jgi:purine-binding chemotaxis protein CheW
MRVSRMSDTETKTEYVAFGLGAQLFGLPISRVQDVFVPERVTRIPLAPPEIAGLVNVRGRILTVIDMWRRLEIEPSKPMRPRLAMGIEQKNESYALLIESIGDVLKLPLHGLERNPANLETRLAHLSAGVYRLPKQLLLVLDIDRVLDLGAGAQAAA